MLSDEDGVKVADAAGVGITSPDKVLFAEQGVTKARLLSYYNAVSQAMLPFISDRPLSLVRCPAGQEKHCFFQKHDTGGFHKAMKSLAITERSGARERYFYLDGAAGLFAGVQMGVLEFHIWGSRRDDVEKPDRIVFDIDPDEGLNFAVAKHAATDLRRRLDALGLASFPMVTGGKGIHVVVPVIRRTEWPAVKAFASDLARSLADEQPDRFTAALSKAKRQGRVFIDILRNDRGSTAIAPFSTRARAGAPVAVPVDWDELPGLQAANVFSLEHAVERARAGFWSGYDDVRQSLTKKMLETVV